MVVGSSFRCSCAEGYHGETCELDTCSDQPCLYNGTCTKTGATFECACGEHFSGTRCEITACSAEPCQNAGECSLDTGDTGYKCTCPEGYYGTMCENDPCTVQPCKNNGQCRTAGGTFECVCPAGYFGHDCWLTPCALKKCENGADCVIQAPIQIYFNPIILFISFKSIFINLQKINRDSGRGCDVQLLAGLYRRPV